MIDMVGSLTDVRWLSTRENGFACCRPVRPVAIAAWAPSITLFTIVRHTANMTAPDRYCSVACSEITGNPRPFQSDCLLLMRSGRVVPEDRSTACAEVAVELLAVSFTANHWSEINVAGYRFNEASGLNWGGGGNFVIESKRKARYCT